MTGGFRSLHPAVLMLYYAGLVVFAAVLFHPVYLASELAGLLLLLMLQGHGSRLLRGLIFLLPAALFPALLNPLFSHRGSVILFYWMDQPITLESILYGAMMGGVLLTFFVLFMSYNETVTTDKLMYLFSGAAPKSALLLMMAIRFVPLFQRRLGRIATVQRTRGVTVAEGRLRDRAYGGMTLIKVLIGWSLEEALQTADSMKARGYGVSRRTSYAVYRLDRRDRLVAFVLGAASAPVLIGAMTGYGSLAIYPRLEAVSFAAPDWIMYGSFCVFLLTPAALEGKERWVWRSSAWKDYPSATPAQRMLRLRESRSR